MVTLYHWDLPQKLQEVGGWANPLIVDYFTDYARVAFDNFGDRVKHWITMNEPTVFCGLGYANVHAPGYNQTGIADYHCGHHVIKAHAKTYHVYDEEYRPTQAGKIGITLNAAWHEPWTNTTLDIDAAFRKHVFDVSFKILYT